MVLQEGIRTVCGDEEVRASVASAQKAICGSSGVCRGFRKSVLPVYSSRFRSLAFGSAVYISSPQSGLLNMVRDRVVALVATR